MEASGFTPVSWLPGRHLETIVPALWPAAEAARPVSTRIVRVDDRTAVRVLISRPATPERGTLLLVHGIGGSAESGYMKRTADLALDSGWATVRMNCRNCGGTEALSDTLYNAGQSDDVGRVLEDLAVSGMPRPYAAVGFSLGGNLVLRYAGLAGSSCLAAAVAAVNPPIDLEACCRSLERPANALYHLHFTLSLCRLLRKIRRVRELPGPSPAFRRVRTLRRLDSLYTAPDAGYASAEAYYAGASAGPHLARIEVPTLVISSENDPFVPVELFAPHRLRSRNVRFVIPARGGHLGYRQAGPQPFWAGESIVRFVETQAHGSSPGRDNDVTGP